MVLHHLGPLDFGDKYSEFSAQFYTVLIPTATLSHEDLFSQEVLSLLSLSMMERVILHCHGTGFYSKYFLIPKKKEG